MSFEVILSFLIVFSVTSLMVTYWASQKKRQENQVKQDLAVRLARQLNQAIGNLTIGEEEEPRKRKPTTESDVFHAPPELKPQDTSSYIPGFPFTDIVRDISTSEPIHQTHEAHQPAHSTHETTHYPDPSPSHTPSHDHCSTDHSSFDSGHH